MWREETGGFFLEFAVPRFVPAALEKCVYLHGALFSQYVSFHTICFPGRRAPALDKTNRLCLKTNKRRKKRVHSQMPFGRSFFEWLDGEGKVPIVSVFNYDIKS